MLIKLRFTAEGWIAFSPQLQVASAGGVAGSGLTSNDALLQFFMLNAARLRPVESIHYDMSHALTASYVTTHSISNTKLL